MLRNFASRLVIAAALAGLAHERRRRFSGRLAGLLASGWLAAGLARQFPPAALPARAPARAVALPNDADPASLVLKDIGVVELHFPRFTDGRAVRCRADITWSAVSARLVDFTSAAAPATCGVAMEVPLQLA